MRVAPAVILSPEERVLLLRWSRGNSSRNLRALRARIVLEAASGRQDLEIGRRLGVGRLTAARWRKRFLTARVRGIERPTVRVPRKGGIPEPRIREILRDSVRGSHFGPQRVSTRTLARKFGVSHTTVRRIWSEYGLRPAGIEATPRRPDPALPLEPQDVVGLYLRPPDFAAALILGPGPGGLGTPRPDEGAGLAPSFPWDGTAALARSLPATWSTLPPVPPSRHRLRDLLRFLGELERATGRQRPLRIIATLPELARATELRDWLARRPNVRLDRADHWDAFRSRVLRDLDRSGRLPPTRGRQRGRGETARSIGLFLTSYTDSSGPFQWVASSEEVAANDAGSRLRYDLSVTGHPGFKKPLAVRSPMRTTGSLDGRARQMAHVVLGKCLRVRPGEDVAIMSWSETLEYANAFVLEALRLGAHPLLLYQDEPTYWAAVAENRPSNLARIGGHLRAAIARSDALVTFFGPSDRERFHALPRPTGSRLDEYRDALYGAAARAGTRAVQLALGRASPASARMYGVDLATWKAELVNGTTVDPELLHRRARRLSHALRTGRSIEIAHPNGTRLRLGLRHRRAQVSDGLVPPARPNGDWNLVQLPAGVVSVALDERVADGTFRSNVRNSVGVFDTVAEVDGGVWSFSDGRLRRFTYDRGHELFSQSYERGGLGKDRVGLLSVGLNDRITMAPLLLDQEAGTLTLQLGRNDSAGGTNHVYWWAWLLLRGADLTVDGKTLVKAGKLVE
jgi:leucyl aminopeptidase (aminopeptidase T)/transposase